MRLRNILSVFALSTSMLLLGAVLALTSDNFRNYISMGIQRFALNTPRKNPTFDEELFKMDVIALQLCASIYPAPKNFTDCMNTIHHGVASSFDPHSAYYSIRETEESHRDLRGILHGIGISIGRSKDSGVYNVKELIPGGSAKEHGIKPKDRILEIDGTVVTLKKNIREVVNMIRGEPGTRVRLVMQREGEDKPYVAYVERRSISTPLVEGKIVESSMQRFGYIKVRAFGDRVAQLLQDEVRRLMSLRGGVAGFIIDLENNPGGSLFEVDGALDLFMDAPSFVLQRDRRGISPINRTFSMHTEGDITHGLPIVVIINEGSASASEIFAGAMQHYTRALIYGRHSFGKGTIQNVFVIPDGSEMRVTVAEYLIGNLNDWVPVQCVGVTPDIYHISKDEGESYRECMQEKSVASLGGMEHPPEHPGFARLHPKQHAIGMRMIDIFEKHIRKN